MKNIYIYLLTSYLLLLTSFSFSQTAPAIEWQNTIGGFETEFISSVSQTTDGGYICGGFSNSYVSGDKTENNIGSFDCWVVKIDSGGNIQWQNTIGGNAYDELNAIEQTIDGGYILGVNSYSGISGDKTENNMGAPGTTDYWVIKLDAIGNVQWQNTIGGDNYDELTTLVQTSDGGYIMGGSSESSMSGDKIENCLGVIDYWVVKIDLVGNIQWQNTIGGDSWDYLYSIEQTSDGGYILGGQSNSNISGDKSENSQGDDDYWVVRLDNTGNIVWQNTIGGNAKDRLFSIQQISDGGYVLGGVSESNISGDKTENCLGWEDYWVIKLDSSGNIQWQNTIGGNDHESLNSVKQTDDGEYILGGSSLSNISGDKTENSWGALDYWILKLDTSGSINWQNTIGGDSWDGLGSLQQTDNGGYILGGTSSSGISGDKTENSWNTSDDYWIIKFFPDTGISTFNPEILGQSSTFNLQFSPNPLTTLSTLTFNNPQKEKFVFTLYDITGRLCAASPLERGKGCVITTDNKIILERGSKQAGVYLFRLQNISTAAVVNGKIIVQ